MEERRVSSRDFLPAINEQQGNILPAAVSGTQGNVRHAQVVVSAERLFNFRTIAVKDYLSSEKKQVMLPV